MTRKTRAKFSGLCPICDNYYEEGDEIGKLDTPCKQAVFTSDYSWNPEQIMGYVNVSWGT